MSTGQIIFLNGTSSSGKSTIAKALQETLTNPYMLVSLDHFFDFYHEKFLNPITTEETQVFTSLIPLVVSGLHHTVAALTQAGNHVIVDHVLQEKSWLEECLTAWAKLQVMFVGVRCPLSIVEQREKDRGDRDIGIARYQFDRVHRHEIYDVEVDTSKMSVEACVAKIIDGINNQTENSAFQRLLYLEKDEEGKP